MRTRVKFCGLVRPGDVDAACAMGVDAIGFVFYERSPRLLGMDEARALRRRLPSFVAAVGLFVNAPHERWSAHARRIGLDVVQFHGDETPQDCALASAEDRPWWRAVRMSGPGVLLESTVRYAGAEAWLLDAHSAGYGGSGQGFDWSWVGNVEPNRLILSGGLTAETVGAGIDRLAPWAVDVSSGIQGPDPREKDVGRMERFLDAVAHADAERRIAISAAPSRAAGFTDPQQR